jgi:hypothetical protein
MTTKPTLQKYLKETHTEEDRCNKKNTRKIKFHLPSRLPNKQQRKSKHQINNKMTENTTYFSILTMIVNGLNFPIKRHRKVNWIKKQYPTICCLQKCIPMTKTNIDLE